MAGAGICCGIDILLLVQSIIYALLVVFASVTTGCVGSLMTHFDGQCLLFADLKLGSSRDDITSLDSHPGNCQFTTVTNGLAILYCVIAAIYHFYKLRLSQYSENEITYMSTRPFIVLNFVFSSLGLVTSSVLSAGTAYVCAQWTKLPNIGTSRCGDLESSRYWNASLDIDPTGSVLDLHIAQVSLWLSTVLWIVILGIAIIRHMRVQREIASKKYVAGMLESSGTDGNDADDKEETVLFDGTFRHLN